MVNAESKNKYTTVFYDGQCPMCTTFVKKAEVYTRGKDFKYSDITQKPLPKNLNKDAVLKEIHVVDKQGGIYKNVEAIFKILETNRRYRFLVWLGRLPIIKQLLLLMYRIVARNRHNLIGGNGRTL